MKYSDQKPPNWDKLVHLFGADWKHTIVTYGDTFHACRRPTEDLEVHEAVHSRQQGADPAAWWERYYKDAEFRFEQELEAYREQYKFMQKNTRDRNLLLRMRDRLARDLSSPLYGKCVKFEDAFCMIAQKPSRSQERRVAIQKGQPMPSFDNGCCI